VTKPKLGVLVSQIGTNLASMIKYGLDISLVIADRRCPALDLANRLGLTTSLIERIDFTPAFDRKRRQYTKKVMGELASLGIEVVAFDGFKTILSSNFFTRYEERVLNTHPSLLPAFRGNTAVRDALVYGVKWTGFTVHLATNRLDHGKILAQEPVRVLPGDTEARLHARIKRIENKVYPQVIARFLKESRTKSRR